MQPITAFGWSGIFILVSCLFLLAFAIFRGKTKFNYLLVLLTLPILVWGFGCILIGTTLDPEKVILYWKIAHIGVIFIPPTLFHFCVTFTKKSSRFRKWLIGFIYLLAFTFLGLNLFTPFFINKVTFMFGELYYDAPPTLLYLFFILYFFLTITGCFLISFLDFKDATFIEQTRIKYVIYGSIVASIGGSFNFVPLFGFEVYPVLNFLLLFYPISVGYATLRYRFLNMDLAFREILKYGFIFIFTFLSLWGLKYLLELSLDIKLNLTIDTIVFLVCFGVIFKFLNYFLGINNFFKGIFNVANFESFKTALKEFRGKDFFYKSLKDLESDLNYVFCKKWIIKDSFIIEIENLKKFPELIRYLKKNKKSLIRQELNIEGKNHSIDDNLSELGDFFIPLFDWTGRNLAAVFILKKAVEDQLFSEQELDLIDRSIGHISLTYQILHYNKNLQDEIKFKTRALEQTNKRLTELDESKDNFLAMVSHEMRTPMTVIKGYSEFLLGEDFGPLSKKQSKFVGYIKGSTQDLLDLVNDMLDLSKIEAGRIDMEYERVCLRDFFKAPLDDFSMRCRTKNIKLSCVIDKQVPRYVILDRQKVRLILNNILGNAFKFTEEEGAILMTVSIEDDKLKIEILDDGFGIPDGQIPEIFKSFNQLSNPMQKEHKGTGLGLAIVKKIMDKIGGTIVVESALGEGTKFILMIPILSKD